MLIEKKILFTRRKTLSVLNCIGNNWGNEVFNMGVYYYTIYHFFILKIYFSMEFAPLFYFGDFLSLTSEKGTTACVKERKINL